MKLIAETACHHEGDFIFLKNLVSEINAKTGADIIKFHLTLDIDEYMAKDHDLYSEIQRWIFSPEEWSDIFHLVKHNPGCNKQDNGDGKLYDHQQVSEKRFLRAPEKITLYGFDWLKGGYVESRVAACKHSDKYHKDD